jgi:hypothetical protein
MMARRWSASSTRSWGQDARACLQITVPFRLPPTRELLFSPPLPKLVQKVTKKLNFFIRELLSFLKVFYHKKKILSFFLFTELKEKKTSQSAANKPTDNDVSKLADPTGGPTVNIR